MGKLTQAEVKDLKAALKELKDLQTELGKSTSAPSYAQGVQPISPYIATLIGDTGTSVGKYVDARSTYITQKLNLATSGVSTAINLLTTTISNYENNEKTHTDAANATGNGGGGATGGRGKGGS